MKIAFITDTHIGARGGSSVFRDYFKWYFSEVFFPRLQELGITHIECLGDFFDNRNHINANDIDYVINYFLPLLDEYNVHMRILAGNHDLAYKNTNRVTSLSILAEASDRVTLVKDEVVETTFDGHRFVMIPWINGNNYDDLMKQIDSIEDKGSVRLLGHLEIKGMMMYKNSIPCEHGLNPSIFKEFKSVWSGHFHHPSVYTNIEYLGSAFHLNWQDYGDNRGWWVYDTETDEKTYEENEYSLFNVVDYSDDMFDDWTQDDIEAAFKNQFVIMNVGVDAMKVKIKDATKVILDAQPIKLSINNTYVLKTSHNTEDEGDGSDVQETKTYIDDYVDRNVDELISSRVRSNIDSLYSEANDQLAKGE